MLVATLTNWTAMNRFLSRCVGASGNMRLLSVVNGTLAVFLDVHCSPLDQHLVIQFGTALTYSLPSVILVLLSVDDYLAQWLHPQSSASVLCASFVRLHRGDKCGRIQLEWLRSLRTLSRGVVVCSRVQVHYGCEFLLTSSTERAPS